MRNLKKHASTVDELLEIFSCDNKNKFFDFFKSNTIKTIFNSNNELIGLLYYDDVLLPENYKNTNIETSIVYLDEEALRFINTLI